jgi:hypothetical protein
MSIGAWDPNEGQAAPTFEPTEEQLSLFISLSRDNKLETLTEQLNASQQTDWRPIMQLKRELWIKTAESYSEDEVVHLIRFFTEAEMQLPGWEAAEHSPVIGLVKALRKRGTPPAKELLLWIKEKSNNRFLPNGPLL